MEGGPRNFARARIQEVEPVRTGAAFPKYKCLEGADEEAGPLLEGRFVSLTDTAGNESHSRLGPRWIERPCL